MISTKSERRIGLYGGSFDPIHNGHLNLALEMLESHSLDAVWLCPANNNPRRHCKPQTAAHHRLAMIRLAITSIRELRLLTHEIERPPPSYTVTTLCALTAVLTKRRPCTRLFLILGADSAAHFFNWHQPEKIVELSTVLVGRRCFDSSLPPWYELENNSLALAVRAGVTLTRQIDISSSEIRQRIQNGSHIEHLVPTGVWRYIKRHNLYLEHAS